MLGFKTNDAGIGENSPCGTSDKSQHHTADDFEKVSNGPIGLTPFLFPVFHFLLSSLHFYPIMQRMLYFLCQMSRFEFLGLWMVQKCL